MTDQPRAPTTIPATEAARARQAEANAELREAVRLSNQMRQSDWLMRRRIVADDATN